MYRRIPDAQQQLSQSKSKFFEESPVTEHFVRDARMHFLGTGILTVRRFQILSLLQQPNNKASLPIYLTCHQRRKEQREKQQEWKEATDHGSFGEGY